MSVKTLQQPSYQWIDLLNPEKEELQTIANQCNLNYYNLADSLEPNHLPKFETENDINFFIVRMVHKNAKKESNIENLSNKIAIFYNDKIIVSIHRVKMDFLSTIEEKYINPGKATTTTSVIIKILYSVLQTYNDSIIATINKLDFFENRLFTKHPSSLVLQNIYSLKRKTNLCTKMLILTEEVIKSVKPSKQEKASYQDLKDLYVKLTTLHEQVIEDLNNLLNLYISLSSQKTNEIMKTLTIFSIFFMPLTFIAGIYGMNFKYMPELGQKWGYPIIMLSMLLITLLIYFWLKKKKWL
ncbi:CorA family divalent cation transporter [Apibacter raozihei]|uniref:CorA family divalent cation transporter n=1 Tax=Apibacter raozihei TaxID=2500547 RepID=UPI000FE39637|nr:CorA family divalent cation transporter [Apibacter raozihei]